MTRRTRRAWRIDPLAIGMAFIGLVMVWIAVASALYSPEYVRRVLAWRESDQGDYLNHFPLRPLLASPSPYRFVDHREDDRVRAGFEHVLGIADLDEFLSERATQAFIVIQGHRVLYEHYFNGAERDSMLTSFSVAKSFDSALVGLAIDEGHIRSVDDAVTDYLPELGERDERFGEITIRDLLQMSSGLGYDANRWALFNGDDPLTTYYPDQRELALERTHIIDAPGSSFSYNKYHPQLLGLILERTTAMSVTAYTQTRLWDRLGMEFDGAWALDGDTSGFEKMEAGLNARAIDYAKLGILYRDGGAWNGDRVLSRDWIEESTSPDPERDRAAYYRGDFGRAVFAKGKGYYGYMWYGRLRPDGPPDFAAEGDHGQFIYVSPAHDLVIVRNGTRYGMPTAEWINTFYEFADQFADGPT